MEITLNHFNIDTGRQKYHVYRLNNSISSKTTHVHDYYQICYVDCGHIEHWQEDSFVRLSAGDAFIIPPGFPHKIAYPDPNAFIYSLAFDESMFHSGFSCSNVYHFMSALKTTVEEERRLDVRLKISLNPSQRSTVKSLLESLIRETEAPYPIEYSAAGSLVAAIMCILSQGYFFSDDQISDISNQYPSIIACINYIDNHYTERLTLRQLSEKFALSRSTFCSIFPKHTGMTLTQYVSEKRITKAINLIQNTDISINAIAKIVGYSEVSTFYRNFIKRTGAPPSSYRPYHDQEDFTDQNNE